MDEHKYVSLRDLLRNEPAPEQKLRHPIVENKESDDSHSITSSPPFDVTAALLGKGSFSDFSPASSSGSSEGDDDGRRKGKKAREKKKKKSKKGKFIRLPSMRLSKSDNPFPYVSFSGSHSSEDDLMILSREMRKFSCNERASEAAKVKRSEDEETEEEGENN